MKRADTTNYELDKTVRYVREPVGRVKRLSAAVVVNHRTSVVKGQTVSTPLSDAELAQIKALVNEAVGFDAQRRDSVSVISIPFNESAAETAAEPAFWQQPEFINLTRDIGVALILALAVLYLIIGVIRPAIKQLTTPPPPPEPVFSTAGPAMMVDAEAEADAAEAQPEEPLEKVRRFARENPQVVATVIRQWVNDV
ncbi:hypothetical protein E2I20_10305 [Alcaligenaceae bacterium SAGV3]|nr:hypothetical protein [Alcaligenaceae bacterium SAGV3]